MKKNKFLRRALYALLVLCMIASLPSTALAADYTIPGVAEPEYYSPTDYEDSYGSVYQYGGMNAVDLVEVSLPFGYNDGTSIGAAERVSPMGLASSSGEYGVLSDYGFVDAFQVSGSLVAESKEVSPYIYRTNAFTSVEGMELPDGSLGTVQIPSLGIEVKAWEGETTASMAKGLGHYSSSSGWDGNVCFCGHNRGAKCAIGPIKDLEVGDTIIYTSIYGTRTYSVCSVNVISSTDWSSLQPTPDNRITLTTCLANQPDYRICVQAVEVV